MAMFWQRNKKTSLFLIGLLSITLLCAQSVQFHIHTVDHAPVQEFGHGSILIDSKHDHPASMHLSIDTSHVDHHDLVVNEMDVSPDTLVRQSSIDVPSMDLLILLFTLFFLGIFALYIIRIRHIDGLLPRRRFYFVPLLRAPPL
jgi:hypothetical protein